MRIKIAPSMISADLAHLADAIAELEKGGADLLHVDVADGHFVPNIMCGADLTAAIAKCATIPVNVHLMITDPVRYAPAFVQAGARGVFFHVEVVDDLLRAIRAIKKLGAEVGVALKPGTPPETVETAVGEIDCLMAMTVEPGFGGQAFMEAGCLKIPALRGMFGSAMDIYADGGINPDTAPTAARYGANVLVAGHALFQGGLPVAEAIKRLRQAASAPVEGRARAK
jgi:ribulose-phosphate 3-epimerase